MSDLKAVAEDLGLRSVRTYIASGNLVFVSDHEEEKLKTVLEKALHSTAGRPVRVILRSAEEMEAVRKANPFPDFAGNRVQVFFLDGPPPPEVAASARNVDDEQIAAGKREIFVAYGENGIGRSRLRLEAAEAGTARNMNTVAKLAELAKELA
jgi:uncharacterized protein (DUF1697 family)